MNTIYYNNYYLHQLYEYSIIIYYKDKKPLLIQTLNQFKKLYANIYNFEVIIIQENVSLSSQLNDIIDIYNFPIQYIIINDHNIISNLNKIYNYAISVSAGNILILQDCNCLHINDILNKIDKVNLLENYLSIPIYKLSSYYDNISIYKYINSKLYINEYDNILYKLSSILESKCILDKNWISNSNINNFKNNYAFSFLFLIIYRKNIDILYGFDETLSNLNLNDFFNRLTKINKINYIDSVLLYQYDGSDTIIFTEINNNIKNIDNSIKTNNLSWCFNDINNDINNKIVYKQLEYTLGIAVSIYSDENTPSSRIEASKIFIKSLIDKIKDTIIIFVIDKYITEDHYDFLLNTIKDNTNIEIYKNINNFGISKTKNICIKLLENKKIDYICLLDDDIDVTDNFTNYIKYIFNHIDIPLLTNYDNRIRTENNKINNINFIITKKYMYFGNFVCFNSFYFKKLGYFICFPYKYGIEHIEITERYLVNTKYYRYCVDILDYIKNEIFINNKSQLTIHSVKIENSKIKLNSEIMQRSINNIKYIPFDFNSDEVEKIII